MAAVDQDLNPWVDGLTISDVLPKTTSTRPDKDALIKALVLQVQTV